MQTLGGSGSYHLRFKMEVPASTLRTWTYANAAMATLIICGERKFATELLRNVRAHYRAACPSYDRHDVRNKAAEIRGRIPQNER
jgi:hypothetical protein